MVTMKLKGAWGIAAKFISMAALFCCVLLWTVFVGAGKRGHTGDAGSLSAGAERAAIPVAPKDNSKWAEAYGRLPMSFEENQGQTAREVRFVAHGGRYELFLTSQEAVIALRPTTHLDFSPRHRSAYLRALRQQRRAAQTTTAIRMRLEGANPAPQISGAERLPTRVNYFTGSDPKNWHTDVPAYARVKYAGIYPGVDLVFYGNQRMLEYDFVVAPGADPKAIQLKIAGARKMHINSRGDLVLSVPEGEVQLQKPLIYQLLNGEKREVAGNYLVTSGHRVTFSIADYDRSKPLILDPVLNYSTYLGGSGVENYILPVGIAVDGSGDTFVAGETTSVDFPAGTNAGITINPNPNPNSGASYVAELNPAGTQLLYSTYLVGTTTNGGDGASGVAVDSTGKVYVAGVTFAAGFPTKNPIAAFSADTTNGTCFVTKLDPTVSGNSGLLFSTYLGGTGGEFADAIAVDSNDNAYVVGQTISSDFPVTNGVTFNAANVHNAFGSGFLSKIDIATSTLVYSTYLSGNAANAANSPGIGGEIAYGVAVDSSNNAYVVGATTSNNATGFPSINANETAPPAANVLGSAFVAKINTAGNGAASLVYSTYIAGSTQEIGYGIGLGPNNVAYVVGDTTSNDFPFTPNAFDTSGAASGKAFVAVVDTTKTGAGNSLTYATFLGGSGGDVGYGVSVDGSGNAYVVGTTASTDFPGVTTLGAFQPTLSNPSGSAFIVKLFPGSKGAADLLYSTYFGGSGDGADPDQGFAIAIDSANPPNAYITGQTSSANLPVLGAPAPFQANLNGTSDGFIAKLTLIPTLVVTPSPYNFGVQPVGATSPAQTFTLTNNTSSTVTFTSITVTGVSPALNTDFVKSSDLCSPAGAAASGQCTVAVTFTPSVAAAESATLAFAAIVTEGGRVTPQTIDVSLSGTGSATAPGVGFSQPNLAFGGEMLTTTSGAMTIQLTNNGAGPLTISSIAGSGDFTATSTGANACPIGPATLPAAGTCSISVTFAPTALNGRTGNLTVTDNAGTGMQTVPLTGTGWDFSLAGPAQAPPPITSTAPGNFNITMTPLGGFNQNVTLTCAVTPAAADATCTVASPVKAADGMTVQNAAVMVTTTAAAMVPPGWVPTPPASMRQVVPLILALLLLLLVTRTKRLRLRLGMVAAMLMLIVLAGCNGSGKPILPPTPIPAVLTITGTSNGSAGAVSHKAVVQLTVN
jgi:hypothetical protein